jgi:sugar O-acyltransferase (sialic acid O-acetyltransferase NeuD family)
VGNLLADGYNIFGLIDDYSETRQVMGIPIFRHLPNDLGSSKIIVAVGDNVIRSKICFRIIEDFGKDSLMTFISSRASVSSNTHIDSGCVILSNAYIGPEVTIQRGSIVNTGAVIEHNSRIGEWSSIAPSATLAGSVCVGDFSHIGIGAVVDSKINVGTDSILGANSLLLNDLASNVVAVGNPARIVRTRVRGEKYLK